MVDASQPSSPDRRRLLAGAAATLLATGRPASAEGRATTAIVPFDTSAFPFDGEIPDRGGPFLDVLRDGRRGHTSPRGGVYFEDPTYASRDVLIAAPAGLDPARPLALVVFFHGNRGRLGRDVIARQGVARQLAASGLNAVLVAPQMAVDALDSSAGRFWTRGHFARFLAEAAAKAGAALGRPGLEAALGRAPVFVVAYSGGYLPTAFALERGGAGERIAGVILLDGIYAEEGRFADWIGRRGRAFFFSAHSPSTRAANTTLRGLLTARGVAVADGLPKAFSAGEVRFLATPADVVHDDFLTRAWVADPLAAVLSRIPGFPR